MAYDYYVYLHRKKACGTPFYVGKGKGGRSASAHGRNPFWKKTVNRHGYYVEIVATGLQEWYAFELEKDLISLYGRRQDASGTLVNMTDGGEGCSGHKMTDESKAKISTSIKRVAQTDKWKKDRAEILKRLKTKQSFKEAHRKAVAKEHNIPVLRGDGKLYVSITAAAEDTNADASHICKVLKGKRNKAAGFTWRYLKEEEHGL